MPLSADTEDAIQFEGLPEARQKVIEFLTKTCESLETEGEVHVTLSQAAKHGEQYVAESVYAFDEKLEDFVEEVMLTVMKDAEDIGRGRIKYSIKVKGVKGRVTFAINIPEREGEDEDDLDEVPNKRGLIGQQMRHTEALMKITVGFAKENQKTLREENKELRQRIRELEAKGVETVKQYEELISMRHVRDLEFVKLQNGERRKDQVGHLLMMLAPTVAAKFLGGGAKAAVEVGAKTPFEVMIEGFLSSLDAKQLQNIANSDLFTGPQKLGLQQIIMYVIERQEAEMQAQQARNGQANGSNGGGHPPPQQQAAPQGVVEGQFVNPQ